MSTNEPDAPYYTRRVSRRWGFGVMMFLALAMALSSTWSGVVQSWTAGLGTTLKVIVTLAASFVPILVLTIVWLVIVIRWERRTLERLEAADFRLCPKCSYPLKGHTGSINCPECGTHCDVETVQRAWRGFKPRISGLVRR